MLNNWQAIYQGTNNDYKKISAGGIDRRSSGINDFRLPGGNHGPETRSAGGQPAEPS